MIQLNYIAINSDHNIIWIIARPLFVLRRVNTNAEQKKIRVSEPVGFFSKLFGGNGGRSHKKDISVAEVRTVKPRKAPIKIEPKVFFSNERTFLAWMHVSVILAGASVAILAISDFENIGKQVYGLIMLPVAVAFLVYAMNQCKFYFLSMRGFDLI